MFFMKAPSLISLMVSVDVEHHVYYFMKAIGLILFFLFLKYLLFLRSSRSKDNTSVINHLLVFFTHFDLKINILCVYDFIFQQHIFSMLTKFIFMLDNDRVLSGSQHSICLYPPLSPPISDSLSPSPCAAMTGC